MNENCAQQPSFSTDYLRSPACVTFVYFLAPNPFRGDGGVPERAASDLSQFAIQARALSVHTQASQRLRGSFPATAPSRGQRH